MNDLKIDTAMPTLFYDEVTGKPNGHSAGLSKREYYAALAMQTICNFDLGQENSIAKEYARRSVIMADALIEALNK